jgi:glutamate--cysteine ligase
VRLKKTLEVRGGDSLPRDLFAALPAFWTGILYDERALDQADELTASFSEGELDDVRPRVAREGLEASFRDGRVSGIVARLLDIARGGLERRARLDPTGRDERHFLEPLEKLSGTSLSAADRLIARRERASWAERLEPVIL